VTGYLYPYGDSAALAERILRLLTDATAWTAMSERARQWAARFTWDRVTDDAMVLLEEALAPTA
jgi:glycosyltransferase involved in cell wall biosynthesis